MLMSTLLSMADADCQQRCAKTCSQIVSHNPSVTLYFFSASLRLEEAGLVMQFVDLGKYSAAHSARLLSVKPSTS